VAIVVVAVVVVTIVVVAIAHAGALAEVVERLIDGAAREAIAVAVVDAIDVVEAVAQDPERHLDVVEAMAKAGVLRLQLGDRIDLHGVAGRGASGDAGACGGRGGGEGDGREAGTHVDGAARLRGDSTISAPAGYGDLVRRGAKSGIAAGVTAATWGTGLFVAGFAARGCVAERMQDRLAASLDARVRIDAIDVGLVRGAFAMRGLAIDRQNDGNLH